MLRTFARDSANFRKCGTIENEKRAPSLGSPAYTAVGHATQLAHWQRCSSDLLGQTSVHTLGIHLHFSELLLYLHVQVKKL